jgi:pyrophosphatase PpaX
LFDLDGTLVDSIGLIVGAMHHAYAGRTRRPTDAEWVALIGTPLQHMLGQWADGPDDVHTLVARYREYQVEHHDALTQPYPGVAEVVRGLHEAGHPMALVTSKGLVLARRALEWVGIAPYFRAVVGLESTTRHKPLPDPVWHALAELGHAEARGTAALFVGDSPHDIHAGNAAGVLTVAAQWGPFDRRALADARPGAWLRNIRDLPPLLAELDARP